MFRLPLGEWVDSAVDWLQTHLAWLFDAISSIVSGMFDGIAAVLSAPAPLLFAGIVAVIAWWLRGLPAALLTFVGFALIDSVELWDEAMDTLTLVLVATLVTLVIAVPLGIWASRSRTVSAITRPVLDFMQTMPAMVYLIPGVIFFGVGVVPGIIATIIFALPPGVRMTELGIRQVDGELVEAAEAFGTTSRNTLLRVQLPLALPTIMAGINQVIMLGLSMVVIAGMVGGGGLGGSVYRAIGNVDVGLGFEAGISIVILAMYLDRMTGALGTEVSPLGRRAVAKAQAMAEGWKIWTYRPQPRIAAVGIVVLALVAGGMSMFGGAKDDTAGKAARIGDGKKVSIGYIPWDEGIASTFLWKEMLEQRGFEVDVKQYEGRRAVHRHGQRADRLPDRLLAAGHPRQLLGEVQGPPGGPRRLVRPDLAGARRPRVHEGRPDHGRPEGSGVRVQGPDRRHRAERRMRWACSRTSCCRATAWTRSTSSSTAPRRPCWPS